VRAGRSEFDTPDHHLVITEIPQDPVQDVFRLPGLEDQWAIALHPHSAEGRQAFVQIPGYTALVLDSYLSFAMGHR